MADQKGYEDVLKTWEAFLKASPKRFIRIINTDTNTPINNGSVGARKTYIFWKNIQETHGSMIKWIDSLILNQKLVHAKIFFRVLSGGSGSKNDPSMDDRTVDFSNRLQNIKDSTKLTMENSTAASQKTTVMDPVNGTQPHNQEQFGMPNPAPAPFAPFSQPQYGQNGAPVNGGLGGPTMMGMGGAAAAAHIAGLGFYEFTELKKNADRAAEYKEDLAEHKKRLALLEIENRDLATKVSNAEQAKELAIMQEKNNNRGFMDSEGIQKVMEMAPGILQAVMASKGGGAQQAPGLNAPSNLSQVKQELVGYIQYDDVNDHTASLMQQVLMMLLSNPANENKLIELLNTAKNGVGNG